MENLIYTLIAAGVGGLTLLAYKHPHAYGKLHTYIITLIAASMTGMTTWNYAITRSSILASKFITAEKGPDALNAFRELEFSTLESLVLPMIAFAYHAFLLALPKLMEGGKHIDDA